MWESSGNTNINVQRPLILLISALFQMTSFLPHSSLQASSLGRSMVRREKEAELKTLQLRLWNLNSTFNSPVRCVNWAVTFPLISVKRKRGRMKTNIEKHVPRVIQPLLMSSPPISILHQLFQCRYSNSRDVVVSSPSFFLPTTRVPRRACSQANLLVGIDP